MNTSPIPNPVPVHDLFMRLNESVRGHKAPCIGGEDWKIYHERTQTNWDVFYRTGDFDRALNALTKGQLIIIESKNSPADPDHYTLTIR